jgi:hypothetical protein
MALFLGLDFRKLYLVPQTYAVAENCVTDRTRRALRILFWVFAPLSLALRGESLDFASFLPLKGFEPCASFSSLC